MSSAERGGDLALAPIPFLASSHDMPNGGGGTYTSESIDTGADQLSHIPPDPGGCGLEQGISTTIVVSNCTPHALISGASK